MHCHCKSLLSAPEHGCNLNTPEQTPMTCSDLTASPRNSCSHLRFLPPSLRQPAVSLLVEYYLMGLLYHQEHDGTKGLNKPSHSDSPSSTSPLPSRSLHLSLPWPCGQTHHPSPLSLSLPPLLSPSLSHDLRGGLPWWCFTCCNCIVMPDAG